MLDFRGLARQSHVSTPSVQPSTSQPPTLDRMTAPHEPSTKGYVVDGPFHEGLRRKADPTRVGYTAQAYLLYSGINADSAPTYSLKVYKKGRKPMEMPLVLQQDLSKASMIKIASTYAQMIELAQICFNADVACVTIFRRPNRDIVLQVKLAQEMPDEDGRLSSDRTIEHCSNEEAKRYGRDVRPRGTTDFIPGTLFMYSEEVSRLYKEQAECIREDEDARRKKEYTGGVFPNFDDVLRP